MGEMVRNHVTTEQARQVSPTQSKALVSEPGTQGDAKPNAKADAKTDTKADAKTDTKADAKPDTKEDAKTDGKGDEASVLALGDQARDVVSQVATQAKALVSTRVAEQTDRGAGDLGEVARALRETSQKLDGNVASPLVEKAADQLDRASQFLQTANPRQMAQAVESFARREPLLFLGGAFAAGIVAARFLKSSSHREDEAANDGDDGGHDAPAQTAAEPQAGRPAAQKQQHHKRHGKHRRH